MLNSIILKHSQLFDVKGYMDDKSDDDNELRLGQREKKMLALIFLVQLYTVIVSQINLTVGYNQRSIHLSGRTYQLSFSFVRTELYR